MEVKSGFWDPESKKRPSRMNRGVPSIEETNTKIRGIFFGDQILSPLNGGVS